MEECYPGTQLDVQQLLVLEHYTREVRGARCHGRVRKLTARRAVPRQGSVMCSV